MTYQVLVCMHHTCFELKRSKYQEANWIYFSINSKKNLYKITSQVFCQEKPNDIQGDGHVVNFLIAIMITFINYYFGQQCVVACCNIAHLFFMYIFFIWVDIAGGHCEHIWISGVGCVPPVHTVIPGLTWTNIKRWSICVFHIGKVMSL